MKLYIIRHGESETNKKGCWTGWLDAPLTDKGINDAKRVRAVLGNVKFDKVFSSDLSRATLTAKTALPNCEYETTPLLREIGLGLLEGKSSSSLTDELRESFKDGYSSVGGESVAEFRERIESFLKLVANSDYKNVAAFSHGGFLTSALSVVFGVDISRKHLRCANCATLILDYTDGIWRVEGWINLP